MRRISSLLALILALILVLAACGGEDDQQVLSDTDHNDQDVSFARDMVQHHAQALAMVDLTLERDLEPEVQQLAEQIRDAQGPEIELMVDWLVSWGEDVPETVRDHANAGHGDEHGDHGEQGDTGHDMPGMLTAEELQSLEDAPDAEFDELWLRAMIAHHQGAVEMAEVQQEEGEFRPAVELAGDIVAAQEAEIARMQALLG